MLILRRKLNGCNGSLKRAIFLWFVFVKIWFIDYWFICGFFFARHFHTMTCRRATFCIAKNCLQATRWDHSMTPRWIQISVPVIWLRPVCDTIRWAMTVWHRWIHWETNLVQKVLVQYWLTMRTVLWRTWLNVAPTMNLTLNLNLCLLISNIVPTIIVHLILRKFLLMGILNGFSVKFLIPAITFWSGHLTTRMTSTHSFTTAKTNIQRKSKR